MEEKLPQVRYRFIGRMTSKGQTTVPKEVRSALGLEQGTQVEWLLDDGGRATIKARKLRAVDLAGLLGPSPVGPVSVKEMNETVGEAVVERFERSTKL